MEKAYLITYKTNLKKALSYKDILRFYVWDAQCDFNFLYFLRENFYLDDLMKHGKKITMVTPCIFTEWNIEIFSEYLKNNKDVFIKNDIEFVINDWGCHYLIQSLWFKNKIILWSHLYYQKRDPYSYELVKNVENNIDAESLGNISVDFDHFNVFFKKQNISSIEIYNHTLLKNIKHLEQDIHIYYPRIVMSITKNCYNYSIFKWKKALSVVEECTWCYNKQGEFSFNNYWITWKYSWNKYTYDNYKLDLLKKSHLQVKRIIYNYDL